MRELHNQLAEVNERYGLERGDDITITGAKHKSTETYRRELADECRTLSNEIGIKKNIYCAMNLCVGYINEATNFAKSQGSGGSDTKDWGSEKDEDEIEWIRRCLRQATKMMKPRNGNGLSL